MIDAAFIVLVAAVVGSLGYALGVEVGQKQHYRGDVVCQELLDKSVTCFPKGRVKQ